MLYAENITSAKMITLEVLIAIYFSPLDTPHPPKSTQPSPLDSRKIAN